MLYARLPNLPLNISSLQYVQEYSLSTVVYDVDVDVDVHVLQ